MYEGEQTVEQETMTFARGMTTYPLFQILANLVVELRLLLKLLRLFLRRVAGTRNGVEVTKRGVESEGYDSRNIIEAMQRHTGREG